MDASKKMKIKKKKEKKQKKQKQKQKQKQIVKTNVKVNVQSSGGSGGSSIPSIPSMPQQTHYIIPPQFKDMTGENVKLNNIIDVIKKQQEDNRILMNRINEQDLERDILLSNDDYNEDSIIIDNINNNQSELNNNIEKLYSAIDTEASLEEKKGRGRPKKYQSEEEKKQAQRMQAYERKMKKSGGNSNE